ncbi:MAG: dimethyl sulfoxide reductase anchor subunit [Coriobacteriales bacterium]|nr:dimethyl sulfoxide reductase anchor subunit [Coriobacteriales bacterium]
MSLLGQGLGFAVSEATLALFTSVAPSGTCAYLVLAALAMRHAPGSASRAAADRLMVVPLAVVLTGLVSSATHLGSPANILYVFSRIGSSPLSTEVFCTVMFLCMGGLYWLHSFALRRRPRLETAWLVLSVAAGGACIGSIACAYQIPTIPTWNAPEHVLAQCLGALTGGLLLVACLLALTRPLPCKKAFLRLLVAFAAMALTLGVVVLALLQARVGALHNALVSVQDLVPHYAHAVALYALCGVVACLLVASAMSQAPNTRPAARYGAAMALMLVGTFSLRFVFYMSHLTVGPAF